MKKKLLALLLVFALLLSCMVALASCGDDEPDQPSGDNGDNGDNGDAPANDPNLNLKEDLPDGNGGQGVGVITDPTSSEAGKSTEDEYIHEQ